MLRRCLALGRSVLKSVFDSVGPGATTGINNGCGNGNEASDNGILEGLHAAFIFEKVLNSFHFLCSLKSLLTGLDSCPDFRTAPGLDKICTRNAGVIPGKLRDRTPLDHGNISRASFFWQRLCRTAST